MLSQEILGGEEKVNVRKIAAMLVIVVVSSFALSVAADDGGFDLPWVNAMNQESYWESYFSGNGYTVNCSKFENHNGHIPAVYDAAVVKSGNFVRVYWDPPNTVLGPINPANNKRFNPPFSWVMKCLFEEIPNETTTTTIVETTTTTVENSTTTSEVVETTTTVAETTTTTQIEETTTTGVVNETTTTSQESTTSSENPSTTIVGETSSTFGETEKEELPLTGANTGALVIAAVFMIVMGTWMVRSRTE